MPFNLSTLATGFSPPSLSLLLSFSLYVTCTHSYTVTYAAPQRLWPRKIGNKWPGIWVYGPHTFTSRSAHDCKISAAATKAATILKIHKNVPSRQTSRKFRKARNVERSRSGSVHVCLAPDGNFIFQVCFNFCTCYLPNLIRSVVYLSGCLPACLSACSSVCLSLCLSVYLAVCFVVMQLQFLLAKP